FFFAGFAAGFFVAAFAGFFAGALFSRLDGFFSAFAAAFLSPPFFSPAGLFSGFFSALALPADFPFRPGSAAPSASAPPGSPPPSELEEVLAELHAFLVAAGPELLGGPLWPLPTRREEHHVHGVLGVHLGDAQARGQLGHQQVPGVVVELALLGGQRAQLGKD